MQLVKATGSDFNRIKETYLEIIDNTPTMKELVKWDYGKHPNDEMIKNYITDGNMYLFMDGEKIAGVTAITFFQPEDYGKVQWQIEAKDDEVMVFHLLGLLPEYQGTGAGDIMVKEALELAREKNANAIDGKTRKIKACRLDALGVNIPAQRFYEKLGFKYCGKQLWYAESTGWTDFYFYEFIL